MTKLYKPLFSDKAQGTLGGTLTYRAQKYGPSVGVRHRYTPKPSAAQSSRRDLFRSACAVWQNLSAAEKQSYSDNAPSGLSGFQYYLKIKISQADPGVGPFAFSVTGTIDSSKIDSTLSWFPLPLPLGASVGLSSADLSLIFDEIGDNYMKLGVYQSDNETQLYVEVEYWDAANKNALLWVSRSGWSVPAGSDYNFKLCFDSSVADNLDFVGIAGARPEVWNSDFLAVYTMAQDPSGGSNCVIDSSGNGHHASPHGAMTSDNLTDGLIGKALNFDGIDDYLSIGEKLLYDLPNLSISCFLKIKSYNEDSAVCIYRENDYGWNGHGVEFLVRGSNQLLYLIPSDGYPPAPLSVGSLNTISTGLWSHCCASRCYNGNAKAYLSGFLENTASQNNNLISSNIPGIIAWYDNTTGIPDYNDISINFLSLYKTIISAAWVKAEFNAQSDNLISWS